MKYTSFLVFNYTSEPYVSIIYLVIVREDGIELVRVQLHTLLTDLVEHFKAI